MIKAILLGAFFLTVALDEFLALGLLIVTGLSAKNAFLYVLILAVLCHKVLERSDEGFQFPFTHILFVLLMAYASLTIFFMHFVIGQTSGFGLFGHIASLKGHLVDFYLLFIVFLYGAVTTISAIRLVKFILAVMSIMILVTLVDVLGMPSLGLVGEGAYGRLEGPVGGPNSYGVFFAVFIPVLIVSAMGFRNPLLRILYFLGAVAAVALLIQTGSRGGLAGVVGGLLLTAWWLRGGYDLKKCLIWTFLISGILAVVATTTVMLSDNVYEIVLQRIERSTSGGIEEVSAGRTWIWGLGLNYMLARPWMLITGAGWGTFWNNIGMGPHSAYLNFFFSLGIIGLTLFMALVFNILSTTKRVFFSNSASHEERVVLSGMTLAWFVMVIAMATGTTFKVWTFLWPLTGLCFRIAYPHLKVAAEQRYQETLESYHKAFPMMSQPKVKT